MSQKESKGKDMGLAASQARLLTLTARKADVELNIMTFSSRKMALAREMQQLSSEYYSKLNDKQISYYANGKYNKVNYSYLMGGVADAAYFVNLGNYTEIDSSAHALKKSNLMVLTDYKGNVVLSTEYANIIKEVMGTTGVCNPTNADYAKMLEKISSSTRSADEFQKVLDDGYVISAILDTSGNEKDNTSDFNKVTKNLIDHYLPVFKAATANGWTTEYEQYWQSNDDYISDSLVSGVFQLATIEPDGSYATEESLGYYVTAGYVQSNSTSDKREAITAWYEAEKLILTNKETYWDTEINNASTELEEIKTEIESVNSLIENAMSVFEWNT